MKTKQKQKAGSAADTTNIRWKKFGADLTKPPVVVQRHQFTPAELIRHRRAPAVELIPACCTPDIDTICECSGVLAQVAGVWRHLNRCLHCDGRPGACSRRHISCTAPQPRQCQQRRCSAPVGVDAPDVCDSCSRRG